MSKKRGKVDEKVKQDNEKHKKNLDDIKTTAIENKKVEDSIRDLKQQKAQKEIERKLLQQQIVDAGDEDVVFDF